MANAVLKYDREIAEWKAQGKAIYDAALADDRELTDDESGDIEAIEKEIATVERRRDYALKAQEWERTQAEAVETHHVAEPTDVATDDAENLVETPKLFGNFGEFLRAVHSAGTGAGTDNRLLELNAAAQGAGEANPAEGGFLVQTDQSREILQKMHGGGELLSRVRRFSLTTAANSITIPAIKETSRATGSRFGGVQGYWVDEGTAPTATNPKLRKIELKLNKIAALGYVTDELMQDAPMMADIMTDAFADELRFQVENAVFRGSGSGQPLGFLAHAATIDVTKETGQGAATIVFENISNMWSRMWARSRANSVWLINQDVEPQLFGLDLVIGTGGVPVFLPANGLADSPFARLMGRPVIPVEYCSTLGTSGDICLVDLSQYVFIDKGGTRSAQSMHVRFTTDEMAFRVTYRVDGQPIWESALTPFQGSNTQSPFITLATRA